MSRLEFNKFIWETTGNIGPLWGDPGKALGGNRRDEGWVCGNQNL